MCEKASRLNGNIKFKCKESAIWSGGTKFRDEVPASLDEG